MLTDDYYVQVAGEVLLEEDKELYPAIDSPGKHDLY